MNTKSKPVCQTVLPWLKANLGTHCLAPLTGQDSRALAVAVHAIALYSSCDSVAEQFALTAFQSAVLSMQPSTRPLAYHSIAHCMDWSDRERIWERAGLESIKVDRCLFE